MADRKVRIELEVDPKGGGSAFAKMAEDAKKAGDAAKAAGEEVKKAQGTGGSGGSGGSSLVKDAILLASVDRIGRSFESAGRLAKGAADLNNSLGESISGLVIEAGRGIPVVGGFIGSIKEWSAGMSEANAKLIADTQFLASVTRQGQARAGQRSREAGIEDQLGALRNAAFDVGASRRAGVGGLSGIGTPEEQAREKLDQAERQARAAAEIASQRQAAEAKAQADLDRATRDEREARLRVAAAQSARDKAALAIQATTEVAASGKSYGQIVGGAASEAGGAVKDFVTELKLPGQREAETLKQKEVELQIQLNRLADQQNAKQNAAEQLTKAQRESSSRLVEAEQKRLEVARALNDVKRAQIDLLKAEEDKVRGAAQSFGTMDPIRQMELLNAARQFKSGGLGGLSQDQLQTLQGNAITSGGINKAAEESAQNNPLFRELLSLTGNRDLGKIVAERVRLSQEVKVSVQLDEEKTKKAVEEVMLKYFKLIDVSIRTAAGAAQQQSNIQVQIAGAAQGKG